MNDGVFWSKYFIILCWNIKLLTIVNLRIIALFVLPSVVHCFECVERFKNKTLIHINAYNGGGLFTYESLEDARKNHPNGYEVRDSYIVNVQNSTILCSHFNELNDDIFLYDYQPQTYDQFLEIQDSNISTLPSSAFSKFTTITKLYLRRIHIKLILPEAFHNLKKLHELDLADNELKAVSRGMFNSLHELQILDLSNNQIRTVEDFAFVGIDNFTNLFLDRNQLREIKGETFQGAKKLEVLDLSQNLIEKFSVHDIVIRNLNLSSNNLQSVDFHKFPKCEVVDFCKNNISVVSGTPGTSQNQADSQNSNSNNSVNLLKINLAFNHISSLEDDFGKNLHFLKFLDLSHNDLSNIQRNLFHDLDNVTFLNLSHNHIESFSFGTFNNLKELTTLDISHNRLLELDHYTFVPMSNLKFLYFESNQIASFDVADLTKYFRKLAIISLADNGIWKCQDLASASHHLKENGIVMLGGNKFDVENQYGVECSSQISERDYAVGDQLVKEVSVKVKVNTSIDDSSFVKFFDSDFRKTNFFQYFENFVKSENSNNGAARVDKLVSVEKPQENANSVSIVSMLVQICIALALLAMIYLTFFKNLKKGVREGTLSQDFDLSN